MAEKITVSAQINAPIAKVWEYYTNPAHIVNWNHASDDWHTTSAQNDLRVGGMFTSRMEAKDGSEGFDFGGTYDVVEEFRLIQYTMSDTRVVAISFDAIDENTTAVEVIFDAETENPIEMQQAGWQQILHNFKDYVEQKGA
jgi:uncharacterized protein YndB with AHSA1/START domain